MKKVISLFFITVLIFSCADHNIEKGNLIVKGKVKGLRLGTLLLKQMIKDSLVSLDSIKVDGNENFEFHTNIDEPQMILLELPEVKDGKILFFATPGDTVQIYTYVENFGINPTVKGGINQNKLNEFNEMMKKFSNKELDLFKAKFDAQKSYLFEEADSIGRKLNRLEKKRKLYTLNFIFQNKDKAVAPYIALTEFSNNPEVVDTIYKTLLPEQQNSLYGKELKKLLHHE